MRPDHLQTWLERLFSAAGAHPEAALATARSLVEAELAGHESHGLSRVAEYLQAVEKGELIPGARPQVLRESPTLLQVDGGWGFGAYAAHWVTERVREKALAQGLAAASLRGCGHLGRAGDYPAALAQAGLFGMAFVNGGGQVPRVAPHGARRAFFGTNPIALAAPGPPGEPPIVADFSTAAVASGKIRPYRREGRPLPEGWVLDAQGNPTTDPEKYYAGGMLLAAAGHKGSALALFADLLAGLMSGAGCPGLPEAYRMGNGLFLLGVQLDFFLPGDQLRQEVGALASALRALPSLDPAQPVQLCGEPEERTRRRRLGEGLELSEALTAALRQAAERWGVEPLPS